ncbi:MAG: 4-hydroxy-tetrahydrodipicolinate synthase [Clostridiales bacterium]|nr:4-hydroxy-tetrahydrodipicolinate synthase [Clostridiales bacterium]
MKQQNPIFRGIATALITPTTPAGVDYNRLDQLIDWQIAQGINALVICGTTGESSTLTDAEHRQVMAHAIRKIDGRVPVICGTGSNETDYAVELTKSACADGADAVLVVTPYYNKTTQNGLVAMYNTIADASTKPVILYNVPSRTGISISAETYKVLSRHPNINGIKEASGDFSLIAKVRSQCGDDLFLWSGNDDNTVPMMALGALGVISVASNIVPAVTAKLCALCLEGDFTAATEVYGKYAKLFSALFIETNPIPVKAAMKLMDMDSGLLRLPLVEIGEENLAKLKAVMRDCGLSV